MIGAIKHRVHMLEGNIILISLFLIHLQDLVEKDEPLVESNSSCRPVAKIDLTVENENVVRI